MIAVPAGVRVWIAGRVTDMRRGMNKLALQVQQGLGRDPHPGEIFFFRGRSLRDRFRDVAELMDEAEHDVLAYTFTCSGHRRRPVGPATTSIRPPYPSPSL